MKETKVEKLENKILEQLSEIQEMLEKHLLQNGSNPPTVKEKIIEKTKDHGKLTKTEITQEFEISDRRALELMKDINSEDIRYVPGGGKTLSQLYYTNTEIARKAAELLNLLEKQKMVDRKTLEEKLGITGKQVHQVKRLAEKFSGGKVKWHNKKIKKIY